jgi:hypothetical protein
MVKIGIRTCNPTFNIILTRFFVVLLHRSSFDITLVTFLYIFALNIFKNTHSVLSFKPFQFLKVFTLKFNFLIYTFLKKQVSQARKKTYPKIHKSNGREIMLYTIRRFHLMAQNSGLIITHTNIKTIATTTLIQAIVTIPIQ